MLIGNIFLHVDKDGNFITSEFDGYNLFPIWSNAEYAELCKIDVWGNLEIKKLDLDDFENEIIDFIADSDYLINVFPIYDRTGFVVTLVEFSRDLNEELQKYS